MEYLYLNSSDIYTTICIFHNSELVIKSQYFFLFKNTLRKQERLPYSQQHSYAYYIILTVKKLKLSFICVIAPSNSTWVYF